MSRASLAERMSRYRKRLRTGHPPVVSEGDSWFDYPLFLNLIDRIDNTGQFAHFRLERSGDTVAGMLGKSTDRRALRDVVAEEQPICLLFSGGGNDLANAAPRLFRAGSFSDPADHVEAQELDDLFDMIEEAYRQMVAEVGPLTPILAHGYDFFQPSPKGVKFIVGEITGPWIHPSMVAAGIVDPEVQRSVVRILVDRFNSLLAGIAGDHPIDFVHVDLRGTLDIDREWANEIHPTRKGFRKVADALLAVVKERMPDLESRRMARRLGTILLFLLASPDAGRGQGPVGQSGINGWGPDLDSITLDFGSRALWRGFDLGSPSFAVVADVGLYGYPVTASRDPTPWGVSVKALARAVPSVRSVAPTGSRLAGTLSISRQVGESDAVIEFLGTGYHGPDDAGDASGIEVGVGVRQVRLPVFEEPDVILDGAFLWDTGRFEGVHGNVGLAVELNLPVFEQRLEVRFGGRAHADSYGARSFGWQAVESELEAYYLLRSFGFRSLSLAGGTGLQRAREGATVGWVRTGLILR